MIFKLPRILSDKSVAINVKLPPKDMAQEFYDLKKNYLTIQKEKKDLQESITKFRSAMTFILDFLGRKYDKAEFEKVCQNHQITILTILKRGRQSYSNPNNPLIDQLNKIDQYNYSVVFYENKIKQAEQNQMRLIEVNSILFNQRNQQNDRDIQLHEELKDKSNQIKILNLHQQLQSVNENSIKIDSDCQQYKEKIEKIYQERDQIIVKMQETLKNFEQIQVSIIDFDQNGYQLMDQSQYFYCKKSYEEASKKIELFMEKSEDFEKELNNQITEQQIQQLLNHQKKNRECFIYVRSIFQETIEMLYIIHHINQEQYQKNQDLIKQLLELEIENNEFKNKIQDQIKELQKSNESELNINAKSYKKEIRLDLSNKYAKLYNNFIEQIMKQIYKLQDVLLKLFPIENQNPNIKQNQELLQDISSFINSIKNRNQNDYNDSSEQQWQRSLELFDRIYPKINNNSVVNKYIRKSLDCITEIRKSISDYKTQIEINKQAIENYEGQQRIN